MQPSAGVSTSSLSTISLPNDEDELLLRHSVVLEENQRIDATRKPLLCENDDDDECAHLSQLQALCPDQSLTVLYRLLDYFHMMEIEEEEILWQQGQISNTAVLLADGALRAYIEEEAGTTEDVQVGSLVGELCLLTGEKRKCTVRATQRSVVYVLTRERLDKMIEQDTELAYLFQNVALRYMSYRLQYVGNRIWETKCLPI